MNALVPDEFIPLWETGLKEGSFALKLCGSGGGGFLLCISRRKESTAHHFNHRKLTFLPVLI
jgi:galactokinase/mevalonate kinase-like predicted kinase